MRYAGVYRIPAPDSLVERRYRAAVRIAHYLARRAARRDGLVPGEVADTRVATETQVFLAGQPGGHVHAVRVEIAVHRLPVQCPIIRGHEPHEWVYAQGVVYQCRGVNQ